MGEILQTVSHLALYSNSLGSSQHSNLPFPHILLELESHNSAMLLGMNEIPRKANNTNQLED